MSKNHRTTPVTREQARIYLGKSTEFLHNAKEAMKNGQVNSAGLLAIHAAISAADAILGHQTGYRSSSPDHRVAVELIKDFGSGTDEWTKQGNRLNRILGKKNLVEYEAREITQVETSYLVEQAERFVDWVRDLFPPYND